MKSYDAVVVGGRGAVGTLLAGLLVSDGLSVVTVDVDATGDPQHGCDHVQGNIVDPDDTLRELLASTTVVVLAVPESVALAAQVPNSGRDILLVETLSVKSRFASSVEARWTQASVLGINPMFAPSLGMDGRPVAAVVHRDGPRVGEFLARLETWGGLIVRVNADEHDRVAAATQALTHAAVLAFGSALASLDVDPALVHALAPPPARTALALLARVTGGEPEVYWDVQSGNPHAVTARSALASAMSELNSVVEDGVVPDFEKFLDRAESGLPDPAGYAALCAALFGIVREQGREENRS
ncbi:MULTISPECIES: prephenate dehydrogenase dimerization domain-containing protein [Nocardiaceae]|uniref:prephenate dehydrogenase dimerization domain-containing protein n=1 Tax=Nocardiaceae TaxID=85025 RepID=UPI000522ED4A|nr:MULTISPECIES: prephenate dehydrogenase dimerization domain-containing protein [Rhodococcus]OZD07643.1 prephenate dehydrogenase/arogenate dehydrogenase family protein [Rhodococcus sp. 06-156-4C]OZD17145.1 prephenate dehydrogenase/arogenate dehydrogenase family protein [Rhodococcus sp. 06-156-3C]OZD18483.1 prephenate dehydrogenase/arogenate dehydrogenase family protein [Rhodococcus sp. 06-156-4a]OZD28316.1 prephenate dehydrogenase/arogenate dehydrogenase family protein [Rhodococcus sp. 06-156-